jgi:hypothetical protein
MRYSLEMAILKRSWIRTLSWNAVETLGTRIGDALVSILLIRALLPEVFATLVLAQAYLAPVLLLLISPGNTVYRFFSAWEKEGRQAFAARLLALRVYGRLVWAFAAVGSVLAAKLGWTESWAPWVWAWTLVLGTFLSGADRDFLKLTLRMRAAAFLSLAQKGALLLAILFWQSESLESLVLTALAIQIVVALAAEWGVHRVLRTLPEGSPKRPRFRETFQESVGSFAFSNHCANVLTNWGQTLDLFVMGHAGVSPTVIGLYSVAQKFANFAQVVPGLLINTFSVWVSRGTAAPETERRWLSLGTFGIAAAAALTVGVCYALRVPLLEIASKGRWSAGQFTEVETWLRPLLLAVVIQAAVGSVAAWFALRRSMNRLLVWVYIPWFASAATVTTALVLSVGPDSIEAPSRAAWSVVAHALFLGFWLLIWQLRHRRRA